MLETLSSQQPVVVALEDLTWADASTLDLLAFLAYGAARTRVLLLGTYRSEEVGPGDPLQRLAVGMIGGRAAVLLQLDPLDRDAVRGARCRGAAKRHRRMRSSMRSSPARRAIRCLRSSSWRRLPAARTHSRRPCGTCCSRTSPAWARRVARC